MRSVNELEQRSEGRGGAERQWERQLICLGDDSPTLGIYSIGRVGGREERGWRSEGANGLGVAHHRTVDREWWRERERAR